MKFTLPVIGIVVASSSICDTIAKDHKTTIARRYVDLNGAQEVPVTHRSETRNFGRCVHKLTSEQRLSH